MIGRLKKTIGRMKGLVVGEPPEITAWRLRAERLNAKAVFNAGHADSELEQVTERQKGELYPRLRGMLNGTEQLVLDLGCGTGRFSGDLATLVGGRVIGADPVQRLLDLAPRHECVEYRIMRAGEIPALTESIDVAFICLVLGGIHGEALDATRREIARVLKPGGLVFLVENTTEARSSTFWTFRSIADYSAIIPDVRLECLGEYDDLGERISIFAGRKSMTAGRTTP